MSVVEISGPVGAEKRYFAEVKEDGKLYIDGVQYDVTWEKKKKIGKGDLQEIADVINKLHGKKSESTLQVKEGKLLCTFTKTSASGKIQTVEAILSTKVPKQVEGKDTLLLERFSAVEKNSRTFSDHVNNVLAAFFAKIKYPFTVLEKQWLALLHKPVKEVDPALLKLKWDQNLLAEICGMTPVEGMTMVQSLTYMSQMLTRERKEQAIPEVQSRLKIGVEIGEKIASLRKDFSTRKAESLVQDLQRRISDIQADTKLLFPVGFFKDGKLIEALLEVSKDPSGKYCAVFISADNDTRDLFDREALVLTGSQSIRREITNIDLKDLLASIPTLIDLQTSPACSELQGSSWQNVFVQTLRYDQSVVNLSPSTEPYRKGEAPGHFGEAISYVKAEQKTPEEAKRFDLALRLRLFLDICKSNKTGLKNPVFWKSVRITAFHLASMIEREKSVLGSETAQGKELTLIYGELKGLLEELDRNPPQLLDIRSRSLPLLAGSIEIQTFPDTPATVPQKIHPHVFPEAKYPFTTLDPQNPAKSIGEWGERIRDLIDLEDHEQASCEAKLMVQMLPHISNPFWNTLDPLLADTLLTSFNNIGEAIARGTLEKEPAPLNDITSITILNLYALAVACRSHATSATFNQDMGRFIVAAAEKSNELLVCHLAQKDETSLRDLMAHIKSNYAKQLQLDTSSSLLEITYSPMETKLSPSVQILLNLNQFMFMTIVMGKGLRADVNQNQPLTFHNSAPSLDWIELEGCSTWRAYTRSKSDPPLEMRAPTYAYDVAHEISNRYATEFCCLGCIKDNCPNYEKTPKDKMRFHPLYMIHNFVDVFCEKLTKKEQLTRDELTDLLYTQQTNQHAAKDLYKIYGDSHGIAEGFNDFDFANQLRNAFMVFLEHPNFFKYPDLRWHFENKLFNHTAFLRLCNDSENKPFLTDVIEKLKKQIKIAVATGDKEVGGYLLHICSEMRDEIARSKLKEEDKKELLDIFPKDVDAVMMKWAEELIGKNDEYLLSSQRMIFTLFLQNYYNKFLKNNNDPCFDSEDLEVIVCAGAQIESNEELKKAIDPESYARCRAIQQFALTKIETKLKNEPEEVRGTLINKILFRINPSMGGMGLVWDPSAFPTCIAKDEAGKFYCLDLMIGKVTFEEKTFDILTTAIRSTPGMDRIFGASLNDNWKIEESSPKTEERVVTYTHNKFPGYRVVVRRAAAALESSKPQIIIERKLPTSLGKNKWVVYTEFETQNRCRNYETVPESPDLPFGVALAIGDRTCWTDRQGSICYVFEDDRDELYATMHISGIKLLGLNVSDFHVIKQDSHLLLGNEQELKQFSAIEDQNYILVFGKKNHPTSVMYPRYEMKASGAPLSYDITAKGVTSKGFPGYKLAPYGVKPGSVDPAFGVKPLPETFVDFHLLQKDGDEKVLIPLRGFEQKVTISGDPLPPTSTKVYSDEYEKCPIYEYSVDKETNRLKATSGDAYAYLAYLCMAHWDYESCAYYLSKARTTAGYDANYDKVIQWAKEWKDTTPSGVAMALRFNLFFEKILDDRAMHQIQEGILQKAEATSIQRTSRLIQLADLYEKFRQTRTALGPVLDLTLDEETYVKRLINDLLTTNGNQIVETNEPLPVSAEEAFVQKFETENASNALGIKTDVLYLWSCNDTNEDKTALTMKHPEWIAHKFRDLFNQIMAADINSIEFQELYNQIRLLSETPLDAAAKIRVRSAQAYLLKLITAKQTNSKEFQILQQKLAPKHSLGRLSGPLFHKNRVRALARMETALQSRFINSLARISSTQARAQAQLMMGLRKEKDPCNMKGLGKSLLRFIDKWEKKSQPAFDEAIKIFLMNEVYGSGGARAILLVQDVCAILDPVQIRQPEQKMQPRPAVVPKPGITYAEKYAPLLDSPSTHNEPRIKELEKEIAARPEPKPQELVTTAAEKIQSVIGDGLLAKYEKEYFVVKQEPPQVINQEVFTELSHHEEPAFRRIAEKNRQDLESYLATAKTTATITKGNAGKLRADLVKQREEIAQEEEILKRNLLQYVDNFAAPAGIVAMRRLVGKDVKPSLDMLIALWRREETAKAWDEHPFKKIGMKEISEEGLKKIDDDIARYLELCTSHNHLNRVIDQADTYLASCKDTDLESYGEKQLANELFEGLQTKRYYNYSQPASDSDFRDMLYVEYTFKIILYGDQVQTLREMIADPNAVRQLRMARGKTEVIMPILAKKKATGKNLVMLMLPEELYETNCRGLEAKNRFLFGQEMHRFEFGRKTDKSAEALEKIYITLLDTVRDKGFVMTTKRSLLSLKDSYVLLLNQLSEIKPHENNEELLKQIRAMSKIVDLINDQGDVLADEIDACLDVRKEVNFALGDPEEVDQVKADVANDLAQIILEQEELKEAVMHNTQATISPERREKLLESVVRKYFDSHQAELKEFETESFIKYIMNVKVPGKDEIDPAAKAIEQKVLGLKTTNNDLFKQIASLKAFIDQGFMMTLGKVGNVNYGRDPVSGVNTIPFKASKVPSINSEYDDDIERICFTYQDYLQNGVTYKQVYNFVARMQHRAIEELRLSTLDQFQNINDMAAAKEFKEFLTAIDPEKKLPATITLSSMCDPKMIENLVNMLNSSPKGLLAFCHKGVVQSMRQYSGQIEALSTEAPGLVKHFGGFTGTPWNIHTYHDKINAQAGKGVDGSTWALMLGRDVETKVFDFDADHPIESLVSNLDLIGKNQGLADTGAYLRGISNVDFIDFVLDTAEKTHQEVSAGVYFDESGKIVKKQKVDEKPLAIEIAPSTDLMTTITLYDQAHTVGADIKQGKKAKLVVTIGENTFIRDLFQAVWRLRQLHLEQRVVLAVSSKMKQRILKETGLDLSTKEGMNAFCRDIHKFCLMNEAKREAEDNFKAEKAKIQGAPKHELLPTIARVINEEATDDTIVAMAKKFAGKESGLFIKKRPKEEVYDDYAKLKTKESPLECFGRLKIKAAEQSELIAREFEELHLPAASKRFTQLSEQIKERKNPPVDWFEKEVDTSVAAGGELEKEAQAETEQELELMVQTETQTQTEVVKETLIPIAQTGAVGHGDVYVLTKEAVSRLVVEGNPIVPGPVPYFDANGKECTRTDNINYFRFVSGNIPFFDNGIVCSAVFERNLPQKAERIISPQSVFYSNRKPVKHVHITKNEKGEWTMIFPTIHEAHGACSEFTKSTKLPSVIMAISAGKPLMVYKSGKDRTNALPFTDKADQEKFYELYIQAKLFNGEIEFDSPEEQLALKKWLLKKGVDEFKPYFEQNIVAAKPHRFIDNYPKSSLFKIFTELTGKPKMSELEVAELFPSEKIVEELPLEPVVPSGSIPPAVPAESKPVVPQKWKPATIPTPEKPTPSTEPQKPLPEAEYESLADLNVDLTKYIWAVPELTIEDVKHLLTIIGANQELIKKSKARDKNNFIETVKEVRKAIKKSTKMGPEKSQEIDKLQALASNCLTQV